MRTRPTKLATTLTLSALVLGLAPSVTIAHPLPRAQWWAMKDVREYWQGTALVGYRGTQRAVSGAPRCQGIGKGSVRRGYGRTWQHFTCVVPTSGCRSESLVVACATPPTGDEVIEFTGRLHPTCRAKFCLRAVFTVIAPTR
jgi:hypothetical protein